MGEWLLARYDLRAGVIALLVTVILGILIVIGSRNLKDFDSALIGYAVATVFAVLGITYRFVRWLARPPTGLYWLRGWQFFLSWRFFRRYTTLIPRAIVDDLAVQTFILPRGWDRWVMHLAIFWGVILASIITFPLVFGWLRFTLVGEATYRLHAFNVPVYDFPLGTALAFTIFHALDFTAVLVIIGVGIALWRRWRYPEVHTGQEFGFDFVPLLLLLAISITGLFLTASQLLWRGSFYWFLALTHQAVVIGAILYIPFGKFWHVLQRPASIGISLYYAVTEAAGMRGCIGCGKEFAPTQFIADLKRTLQDLGQQYDMPEEGRTWQDYCPECKRVLRGNAYFNTVKREFL
jgi:hypothetical protein